MVPEMEDQRGPLSESTAALRANVWLLTGVHTSMNVQVLSAGELFVAEIALGDLFVRVAASVDH